MGTFICNQHYGYHYWKNQFTEHFALIAQSVLQILQQNGLYLMVISGQNFHIRHRIYYKMNIENLLDVNYDNVGEKSKLGAAKTLWPSG